MPVTSYQLEYPNWFRFELALAAMVFFVPFLPYLHLAAPEVVTLYKLYYEIELDMPNGYYQAISWQILISLCPAILLTILFVSLKGFVRYLYIVLLTAYYFDAVSSYLKIGLMQSLINNTAFTVLAILLTILFLADSYKLAVWRSRSQVSIHTLFQEIFKRKFRKINSLIKKTIHRKPQMNIRAYLCRIQVVLDGLNSVKKQTDHRYITAYQKPIIRLQQLMTLLLAIGLVILWQFIPEGLNSLRIGNWNISSLGFDSTRTMTWYVGGKLAIIIACLTWLRASSQWWKYAVLSPLLVYSYQLYELFVSTSSVIEAQSNLRILPFILSVFAVTILIAIAANNVTKAEYYQRFLADEFNRELTEEARKR